MSAFLNELIFAVAHLPPVIPEDVMAEIQKRLSEVKSFGPKVTDDIVRDAMIAIGKMEWPYRHAYNEILPMFAKGKELELLLEHLSPELRKKVNDISGGDVTIAELMSSKVFETEFTADEKFLLEEATLEAREHTAKYIAEQIQANAECKTAFENALTKARADQVILDETISRLEALAGVDEHWGVEIKNKVEQFRLGWSIAEKDARTEIVEQEIDYWKGILTGGGEAG